MATLRITKGPDVGRTFPLRDTQIIGRLQSNEIAIADEAASRRHARLYRREGRYAIVDLGSANGILVQGEKVERAWLPSGTRFTVGRTGFEINYAAEAPPAPTAAPRSTADSGGGAEVRTRGRSSDEPLRSARSQARKAGGPLGIDLGQLGPVARGLLYLGVLLLAGALGFLAWWLTKPD